MASWCQVHAEIREACQHWDGPPTEATAEGGAARQVQLAAEKGWERLYARIDVAAKLHHVVGADVDGAELANRLADEVTWAVMSGGHMKLH